VSKAIGGYVRRCERRYVPPAPPLETAGPNWMRHSVLPSGGVITWRAEPPAFQAMPSLPSFLPLDAGDADGFLASMAGGSSESGPPYVHTLEGPIPPLPDYKPYRFEIIQDESIRCWFGDEDAFPRPEPG
jgi:hypothetical protein